MILRSSLFGDVMPLDEDSRSLLILRADRLVNEVQESLFQRPAALSLEHDAHAAADIGFAACADLVQQVGKALFHDFGQCLGNCLADDVPAAHEPAIGRVRELEALIGTGEHRHEAGRLLEHGAETLGFFRKGLIRLLDRVRSLEHAAFLACMMSSFGCEGPQPMKLGYVDGVLQGSTAWNPNGLAGATGPLRIGELKWNGSTGHDRWNGNIDDVQLYQTALSDSQVAGLYNGTFPSAFPTLSRTSWSRDESGLIGRELVRSWHF